jgi:hypothetical protein
MDVMGTIPKIDEEAFEKLANSSRKVRKSILAFGMCHVVRLERGVNAWCFAGRFDGDVSVGIGESAIGAPRESQYSP